MQDPDWSGHSNSQPTLTAKQPLAHDSGHPKFAKSRRRTVHEIPGQIQRNVHPNAEGAEVFPPKRRSGEADSLEIREWSNFRSEGSQKQFM